MPVRIGLQIYVPKEAIGRAVSMYGIAGYDLMEFITDIGKASMPELYFLWALMSTPNPNQSLQNNDLNKTLEPIVRARLNVKFNILVGPDKPKKEKVL